MNAVTCIASWIVITLVSVAIVAYFLRIAPVGYEDETGWHEGERK